MGFSLFLLAIGAILAFAVGGAAAGVSIYTIGIILMVVGGLGLVMSALFMTTASSAVDDVDVVHHVR
jgi:hypothetical protein